MNILRNSDGLTEEEFLEQYDAGDYKRPSVTVDILVFAMSKSLDSLRILLIKRKDHPFMGKWALAGGFVNIDESAYAAACRELDEETGLKNVYLEQLYTMSQPDRDPRTRVISIDYLALIQERDVVAGDDASEALWFDVKLTDSKLILSNEINGVRIEYRLKKKVFRNGVVKTVGYVPVLDDSSEESLAFDHAESILEGILRIRNKIEYSDIAFNLVPREFTLPDLQRVYEIILGRELYKTNFKAKLVGRIEQLNRKGTSIVGNKSSMLYKYVGSNSI